MAVRGRGWEGDGWMDAPLACVHCIHAMQR